MENLILPEISDYEQEIEKIRAAYALNICSVSVSQIVDYNDQYILDQEYENTLNNLNLERMPKDEAFLDILTETLNVVTFFRIYSSKKQQIEKRYQQKVKNALWSAVPNLAFVVSSGGVGGIYTLIASLATEVGLGYMNYRKTKAENDLEFESNQLELEYTAIEQLNAIRTQLFITSWRIADKYDFPDNYRLTEKQINQYNDILMDSNAARRFSRLFSIRQNFIAFPPFWYYLGAAANSIIHTDSELYSEEYIDYYRNIAQSAYDYYLRLNEKFSVLRNDALVSACALEYCELLPVEESDKKTELLNIAAKWSGGGNDVIQMCALEYLKLERFVEAESLLKKLVDERYSEDINAQLLSSVYSYYYFMHHVQQVAFKHKLLSQQVTSTVLFPLPSNENGIKNQAESWNDFMSEQKNALAAAFVAVMDNYLEKFCYKLNKMFLNFDSTLQYPDIMFLSDGLETRRNEAQRIFGRPLIASDYIDQLQGKNYPEELVDALNSMLDGLKYIPFLKLEGPVHSLEHRIANMSDKFENLQECINKREINYDSYLSDFEKMTFDHITEEFFSSLKYQIKLHIQSSDNMKDIINVEAIMNQFVEKNEIKPFDRNDIDEVESKKTWFVIDASVVGKSAISVKKEKDNRQKIEELIRAKMPSIIRDPNKVKFCFRDDQEFNDYFGQATNIILSSLTKENLKKQTIAIIFDSGSLSPNLLLTYNTVVPCFARKIWEKIKYKDITYDDFKEQINLGFIQYNSKAVDVKKLARCFEDIARSKEDHQDVNAENGVKEGSGSSSENTKTSKIKMIKKCSRCDSYLPETADGCFKCGCGKLLTVPNTKNIQF